MHLYTGASCGVALFIAFSSLLILSLSSFQSEVFAVAFALLAAGAVILTLNVLLLVSTHLIRILVKATYFLFLVTSFDFFFKHLTFAVLNNMIFFQGGHIIFFQSLSLLGYCLFPPDVGAVICMLKDNVILKMIVAWSSWAAYPFMSAAVNPKRKALALYPLFLMYVIAID